MVSRNRFIDSWTTRETASTLVSKFKEFNLEHVVNSISGKPEEIEKLGHFLEEFEYFVYSNEGNLEALSDMMDQTMESFISTEDSERIMVMGAREIHTTVFPTLFKIVELESNDAANIKETAHRLLRVFCRDHRVRDNSPSPGKSDQETTKLKGVSADSVSLRMVVVLHYAELCVEMFPARLDATNIAITFGSILGSLQGGDIFGPEVGIAICALEMVSQRLAKVMQSSGPENSLATPAAKDTQSLYGDDEKTVETLAAILIYGLEMVPSTALTKLCDIIDNLFHQVSKKSQVYLADLIQGALSAFNDPSKRAQLFQWHLGKGRAHL
jgi:hypothetical protein